MKISYNWLRQFISIDKTPEELSLILTDIGLEVESLERVQAIRGGLEGLMIGQVRTCVQHPNADRLRLTTVDVGQEELLSIVCGAPNVAEGQKVIVAPVGATVYPLEGEPFKINKSKIRGEVSEGMLCAEDEIGLGQSHEGILVLPEEATVGQLARSYFELVDDYVYEIGLTPNRADATSHLGVARDIAAYLRISYDFSDRIASFQEGKSKAIPVAIKSEACKRYSSLLIEDVRVEESPSWLKERLQAIGIRPVNNVVDATNYVLHDLGQPLHAFDADQIAGSQIIVRQATQKERFVTLDGVERTLDTADLMICDEVHPLCLAGVFGGESSGVTDSTKRIFLESAYFDAVLIRKSSKRHGLKTDASFRFERGTDPEMTITALKEAAVLITELTGGRIVSEISDIYPVKTSPFHFDVRISKIQKLIGKAIPEAEIKGILTALGIQILNDAGDLLSLEVPAYKVDVTREVDIVEEILRIYGYNNVEIGGQAKVSIIPAPKPDKEVIQNQIAELLVYNGYYETMSNSLTRMDYMIDEQTAVQLLNPLSSDLQVMRQGLLFSLLETVAYNQKRKVQDIKIFEFGKSYHSIDGEYKERQLLSFAITGRNNHGHWSKKGEPASYFQLKSMVDSVLKRFDLEDFEMTDTTDSHLAYGLDYVRNGVVLVTFGVVTRTVMQQVDVAGQVFYASFNWDALLKNTRKKKIIFKEMSKFPSVKRDLALLVDEQVTFQELRNVALRSERKLLKKVDVFDVYKGDRLPKGKKSYALTFLIQDEEKTLGDKQIDSVISKLIHKFEKEIGAEVRQQ